VTRGTPLFLATRVAAAVLLGASALGALTVASVMLTPKTQALAEADQLIGKAHQLADQGQPEAAFAAIEEALRIAPGYAQVHWERAMQLMAWRRLDEAIGELRLVVAQRPGDAGAAGALGEALAAAGASEEAVKWLGASARRDRANGVTWAKLAIEQARLGDTKAALESAHRAVKLAPMVPLAQYSLGYARQRAGDTAGAAAALAQALKLDPNDVNTLVSLAALSRTEGRLEESAAYLLRTVEAAPTNAAAWVLLGGTLLELGRNDAAAQAFTRALALDPDNATARKGLGLAARAAPGP